MAIFKKLTQNPVRKSKIKIEDGEEIMDSIQFNIHKFTNKQKPSVDKVVIIGCFSEFGCEVLSAMYCIPRILRENPGRYVIVMGWYGRAYLYKHLVDEFWELKEEHQHLRDYALAFHFDSHNLAKVEKVVAKMGRVIQSSQLGYIAIGNACNKCRYFWSSSKEVKNCPNCNSEDLVKSLFSDVRYWKQRVVRIPPPSKEKLLLADNFLGKNPVGVIARNRKTYGRNLQPEFYVKLIDLLEKRGYTPIWLGEKQTTLACPVPHIVDMTRKPEAQDLELTLAIVSKLKFTVQFWTASTRLSAIMGTPYLLFESPDQLFGTGQEGYRSSLCTMGNRKIALCHYLHVYNRNDDAIELIDKCVQEMELGDWSVKIGMVDDAEAVERMRQEALDRFG